MSSVTYYLPDTSNKTPTATLTASSANSAYPASNINIMPIAKTWRTTGITSESMLFDLGSAQVIDLAAIINHNFSSGCTITLAAGTTSAVADFSTTITYRQYDAFKILSPSQNYRYWKITVADTGNTDGYLEIGYVMLGSSTQFTKSFSFSGGVALDSEAFNLVVKSEMGVKTIDKLYICKTMTVDYALSLSTSEAATLRAFLLALNQENTPLFIVPNSTINDGYFMRLITKVREMKRDFTNFLPMSFEEDSRGRRLSA